VSEKPRGARLEEVDALRGVAAMAVVLFHFTTRFFELYPHTPPPPFQVSLGHYGVNLFFIISGFVIFMTLDRTQAPMDFVVSRLSRLYPAYWLAVVLTFAVTHTLGLPGKLVEVKTAVANLLMFHGLLGVPNVDGVYWTLEVELLFYCGMLLLFMRSALHRVFIVVALLLGLRWIYFFTEQIWHVDLPWTIYRLLILKYLPWFAMGMGSYALAAHPSGSRRRLEAKAVIVLALATLGVTDSWPLATLALALFTLVHLAACSRLRLLRLPPLVWLGSISYPLYLLHENIGWSLMLRGLQAGLPLQVTAVLSLAVVLVLSHAVSRTVEMPVMHWIRQRYRQHKARLLQA
jgi:peptidoglycan/LPS O-acetylase OafA/YrhL